MAEKKITVLYIDDERHNLYAFRASFRMEFDILLAESAEEARQLLQQHEVPIIIADQRMPRETGIEFFESIKDKHPHSMRILLTGYTDIQAVISAVNIGNIYRYLQKPWQEDEIRTAIRNAYELYDSRRQLIVKNQELEKAYNELDKFVYSASHDMRSPLMSILGIVRLARMEQDQEMTMQYFDMIEESVGRLDEFIRNIIGYYKSNRIEIKAEEVNLEELLEASIAESKIPGIETPVEIVTEVHQEAAFYTDKLKLGIVLSNLISNGIKYQREEESQKKIHIKIHANQQGASISICDNGIGIALQEHEHIFKMFYRATNKNPGSGIGLYITKDAVSKLGGKISLTSRLSEGSTFELSIPNLREN
jgi:two-component system, sensor histidine kinase and response regulator